MKPASQSVLGVLIALVGFYGYETLSTINVGVLEPRTKPPVPTEAPTLTKSSIREINDGETITGRNIKFRVPSDTNRVIVRMLAPNGALKNEYTLSNYISIKPNDKIQIIIK